MGLASHFLLILILGLYSIHANNLTTSPAEVDEDGGRSLLKNIGEIVKTRLNIVYHKLGIIECAGLDTVSGGDLFKYILGPNADFGGDYLCEPTCGGACVPYQNTRVAPISAYPFGCRCPPERCGPNGPVIHQLVRTIFKVVCVRDARCSCEGMNIDQYGRFSPQTGYLCNWINLNLNQTVAYTESPSSSYNVNPTFSPIRWCSCCPRPNLYY